MRRMRTVGWGAAASLVVLAGCGGGSSKPVVLADGVRADGFYVSPVRGLNNDEVEALKFSATDTGGMRICHADIGLRKGQTPEKLGKPKALEPPIAACVSVKTGLKPIPFSFTGTQVINGSSVGNKIVIDYDITVESDTSIRVIDNGRTGDQHDVVFTFLHR